jgi:phage/conjugal plasmid C-4 type zinc finger TraR family protein
VDEFDAAQLAEEQHRARALARLRRDAGPARSRTRCEDCDDDIPAARRKAAPGCTRCVGCQQFEDRRVARFAR